MGCADQADSIEQDFGESTVVLDGVALPHFFDQMTSGVSFCRMIYRDGQPDDFIYLYTNPAFHRQTGLAEVRGKRIREILPGIRLAEDAAFAIYARVAAGGAAEQTEVYNETLQQWRALEVFSPLPGHFVSVLKVITAEKKAQLDLEDSRQRLELAFLCGDLGMWDWHIPTGRVRFNERWCSMLGYRIEDVLQAYEGWRSLVHPDDLPMTLAILAEHLAGHTPKYESTYRMRHKQGDWVWILDRGRVVERDASGAPIRVVGMHMDVTERHGLEERMEELAFYDPLTRLPNRRNLDKRLHRALIVSKRSGQYLGVILIDLDNFKPLNDTHGHATGDLLLAEVGRRLKGCVRESDTVARLGGDEFVVLVENLASDYAQAVAHAQTVAENLRAALAQPFVLHHPLSDGAAVRRIRHVCGASIGVAVVDGAQLSAQEALERADAAMYRAKGAGRNAVAVSGGGTAH